MTITPREKLKVFISSACGEEKYDRLRAELKKLIEGTNLADVYLFEATEASTLTAQQHYLWDLENSDICIFLIDNADGVRAGVQKEIDCAKKHNIKSLFYFCDEFSAEKTAVQKSLTGAHYTKSKVVHSFNDLLEHGAQGLIDDITLIYRYYCKGYFEPNDSTVEVEIGQDIYDTSLLIHKSVIANTDKCKMYFRNMFAPIKKEAKKTCKFDDWCAQFLPVLFEHISIKSFNVNMFLEELNNQQTTEQFEVVKIRWNAIQHYFDGNLAKCVEELHKALELAKSKKLSEWLIKDVLIDLRNQSITLSDENADIPLDLSAQEELDASKNILHYPLIDRIKGELYEKYAEESFKDKIKSPYSVSVGYCITQTDLISDCYSVAMFNGSLTYLMLLHKQIRSLAFWMSSKFNNWEFRKILLRETVFICAQKEIESLHLAFPDILTKLNHKDAIEIYEYCNNHPIKHERLKAKLCAFEILGYYFDDDSFSVILQEIVTEIVEWLNAEKPVLPIGSIIFKSLTEVCYRIDSALLVDICCKLMDKNYSRFYPDMFKLITDGINISEISQKDAHRLINHISALLDIDKPSMLNIENVLIVFRKQSRELTEELDKKISEKLPGFYCNDYKLETSVDKEDDIHFIIEYINQIKSHNEEQGKGGVYHGYESHPHDVIRNIMLLKPLDYDDDIIDKALNASIETLFCDNQSVTTKCQALDLIMFLIHRFPTSIDRNSVLINEVLTSHATIQNCSYVMANSNISNLSLKFSYCLLLTYFNANDCCKLFEVLPYAQNEIPDQLRICKTILNYLENDEHFTVEAQLESILLQTVLTWINSDNVDIRWDCVRILLLLSRNLQLNDIISYQLIHLIDNDNIYIKNLIQRGIEGTCIDSKTKEYIVSQCEKDSNYVVRKVYSELHNN